MDNFSPIEASPLGSLIRPVSVDDDHNQTENTSSPTPLMVTPLGTFRPFTASDDVRDETHNTTTPHPLMITPLRTIRPFDDSNNSYAADAGPGTGPIKRGRGRPKGSKNSRSRPFSASDDGKNETHNTATPPPLMVTPLLAIVPFDDSNNNSYAADAGLSTGPIKRGRGRPKGSKNSRSRPFTASGDVKDGTHNTTTPPPLMVTPCLAIVPFDDSNNNSCAADAGPSTGSIKRGRGRPKGSKNSTTATKKPKTHDPNSKVVTSCPNFDSGITEAERETGNQELVDSVLMRFDAVRRRLCQLGGVKGVLTTALTNCRNLGVRTNMKKRIGPVPGIEVGDIFYFWGEMCLVGLHTQMVAGIDYLTLKDGAEEGHLATSVVTSGHYDDETEEIETLVYTGHGGKDKDGNPCDQRLGRGNLALEASKKKGNEVRVIRGVQDPVEKKKKIYIYDGLYTVTDSWKAEGKSGFQELKFKLVRKPGQPSGYAVWKEVEKLKKAGPNKQRKGFVHADFSYEKENSPVLIVNEVDENDKNLPEDFAYQKLSMISSNPNLDLHFAYGPPVVCRDCSGDRSCLSSDPNCVCVQRNGGKLPYHDRVLVCRRPMVHECGYSCPCPAECKNRIIQTGPKHRMEVFMTESCGWGLRSLDPIRAGTFICEFSGKGLSKKEAEEEGDEYLFDTSRVYKPFKWNYEPELVGEDAEQRVSEVFRLTFEKLISAKIQGNVGRFMNHSCNPNVFWQPVESQYNNELLIRVGFFAKKHIPPMTELRYDYGVSLETEEVGEDGRRVFIGKKACLCGSVKCGGTFG